MKGTRKSQDEAEPEADPKPKRKPEYKRRSSGRPRGRPSGILMPVIVRTRVSYFVDAQITILAEMTGEKRGEVLRAALNHYLTQVDLDKDELKQLLKKMATVLYRDEDMDALRAMINDASRFFGISSAEVCTMLGVPQKALIKTLHIVL